MAQLKFDKYTINGTAQELADYVYAYEKQALTKDNVNVQSDFGTSDTTNTSSGNPSSL